MYNKITMEIKNIQFIQSILEESDVEFAGIFGSCAEGVATHDSDLDLLVRFKKPVSLSRFTQLQKKLSEKLQIPVDLVTEQSLSPYFKEEVLKNIQVVYGAR